MSHIHWLEQVPNYGYTQAPNDNGNWGGGGLSADEWGRNAAQSLALIILRYQLDGIDINIEAGSPAIVHGTPVRSPLKKASRFDTHRSVIG